MLESIKKLDYNDIPGLIGDHRSLGYIDQALNYDPTLATAWLGLVSVMVSAEVEIKPSGAKPEIVDFVNDALFKRLERRFKDIHADLMLALLYGVAPFEITFYRDSDKKYNTNSETIWLKNLDFIHPRHFDLTTIKKKPGEWWITGKCYVNDSFKKVDAVGTGLPVVWWPIYGNGILGSSLMRPVIEMHNEKCEIQEQRRLALKKSIQGSLVALCGEPTQMMDELSPGELQEVADALAHCSDGTDNAVALPPQIKQILPIYPATDSIQKSIAAEDHCDLSMLSAFGSLSSARGILTGYGSQGAAVGDSQAQQGLRSYFFQWTSRQLQDIIDFLVDVNYGVQEQYPELTIVSSAPQTTESLVRAAVQLSSAGAIRYTTDDEAFFRKLLRLPEQTNNFITPDENLQAKLTTGHHDEIIDSRDRAAEYEAAQDSAQNLV